jgi:cell division protein FtsW
MVMLYSASMSMEVGRSAAGARYLDSQLMWFVVGLAGCVAAACMDYRKLKGVAPALVVISALLLTCVYLPKISAPSHGARRWIGLPGMPHFQPSELARLSLVIFVAWYVEKFQWRIKKFWKGLMPVAAVIGLVLALIYAEPDRGCTILLATVTAAMLVLAGVRLWQFIPLSLMGAAGVVVSILHDKMRMNRINAWLHPTQASASVVGYQVKEAMIALGSGGLTGLGLGDSRQKLGFVPEQYTDCIFSIIGEELGLIATLGVVLLYLVLIACGIYIARRARDMFGALLAAGITFMIGLQAFINIGVVTNVLPNKGMPLPFISYGGSNLLLTMMAIGLLLSVARFSVEPGTQESASSPAVNELTNA